MISARYFKYTKERSIITSGEDLGLWASVFPQLSGQLLEHRNVPYAYLWEIWTANEYSGVSTIMEQKAPVKIICLNNNYLGNVRQWQVMFFNRRYSFTPMLNPDYMKVASA